MGDVTVQFDWRFFQDTYTKTRREIEANLGKKFGEELEIPADHIKLTEMFRAGVNPEVFVSMMKMHIAARTVACETVTWPATWWQHFKDRWYPRWLKERFPVKRSKRHVHIDALYPWITSPTGKPAITYRFDGPCPDGNE